MSQPDMVDNHLIEFTIPPGFSMRGSLGREETVGRRSLHPACKKDCRLPRLTRCVIERDQMVISRGGGGDDAARHTSHPGMEVNRLIEFTNVNEHNFPSVLRRTLVFRIESRFVEGNYLDTKLKEGPKCGVFARDPSLRDFLAQGSIHIACAMQHDTSVSEHPRPASSLVGFVTGTTHHPMRTAHCSHRTAAWSA